MKKSLFISFFIISISVIFYSCDDSGLIETEKTYNISGTVNNWTQGSRILKAMVYDSAGANLFLADSTSISSSGAFEMKLKSPPDNFPWLYVSTDTSCTHHAVVNPSNLKICRVQFRVFDSTNTAIGSITRRNFDIVITAGSYIAEYIYFNSDASITGSDTCFGYVVTNFNLTGTIGWNKSVILFNTYMPPVSVIATVSNTEPNLGWWSFGP